MPTLHELIATARERLREAGVSSREAGLDARLLAQHVLGWDHTQLLTAEDGPVSDDFAMRYERAVIRRAQREPLAYVVGTKEFWNLSFEVSSDVLIPRPDTEVLVEAALEAIPDRTSSPRVIDVGTGSGCVAIAIATERPRVQMTATDISTSALALARKNATRLGVEDRVHFVEADLLEGVEGLFDLVVANPPYVRDGDRRALQPEVREFEPSVALFGGPDGVTVLERLVHQSRARLTTGGQLMFEFGLGQEDETRELISTVAGLRMVDVKCDLQGVARVAIAVRIA